MIEPSRYKILLNNEQALTQEIFETLEQLLMLQQDLELVKKSLKDFKPLKVVHFQQQ